MPRIFAYRGLAIEKLKQMQLEEFVKLLPARQRRTLMRGMTDSQKKLLKKIRERGASEKPVRTKVRDMIIIPEMLGAKLAVHDGKEHKPVTILPEMLGRYLGEFVLTRRRVIHGSPGFGASRGSKYVPLK